MTYAPGSAIDCRERLVKSAPNTTKSMTGAGKRAGYTYFDVHAIELYPF